MGLLDVKNLSFKYDNQIEKVFDNVSFQIDTNWKLGLIGRNGKGKTTLLELLMSKYEYRGYIPLIISLTIFRIILKMKILGL